MEDRIKKEEKEVTTMECGITTCCGYDFGLDGFGKDIKVKYCPICGKRIEKYN